MINHIHQPVSGEPGPAQGTARSGFLSLDVAQRLVGIDLWLIESHFRRHVLPHIRSIKGGRVRIVPVIELERWLYLNGQFAEEAYRRGRRPAADVKLFPRPRAQVLVADAPSPPLPHLEAAPPREPAAADGTSQLPGRRDLSRVSEFLG